jgi:hypothetical protein
MATVTNGRVSYKRTVQPADYESKVAECEFSFQLEEDDDAAKVAADLLADCRNEVNTILGLNKPKRKD